MTSDADPDAGRDFRTYIPQAMQDAYLMALGRLIHESARVEVHLSLLASLLVEHRDASNLFGTHTPPPADDPSAQQEFWRQKVADRNKAKLAMGSKGLGDLRSAFRDALRNAKADAETLTSAQQCLDQLGEIQAVRDRLVHHGAIFDLRDKAGWLTTSNDKQTTTETGNTLMFKPAHLDMMSADLQEVSARLEYLLMKNIYHQAGTAAMLGFPGRLAKPFQYKRSQLICYPNGGPNSKSNEWLQAQKLKRQR